MLVNEGPITTFGNLEIDEKFIPYIENENEIIYEYPSGINIRVKCHGVGSNDSCGFRHVQWPDDKVVVVK